jgi:hypothetical protein
MIKTVDVWRDYGDDGEPRWSVSLQGDDGEIRCLASYDDEDEAWARARRAAAKHGVPARMVDDDGLARRQ